MSQFIKHIVWSLAGRWTKAMMLIKKQNQMMSKEEKVGGHRGAALARLIWLSSTYCASIRYGKMLSLLIVCCFVACKPQTKERLPNVIIIFADDLGYGDLSSYGNPSISTPNLDRLAFEGQKWTNFYVAASVCTPSRAALMTGRYPIRNGMCSDTRRVLFPDSDGGLPPEEITIAEQFKKAGYVTSAIGKWHLGHKEEYLPTSQGFDSYFGIPYSNDMDPVQVEGLTRRQKILSPKSSYFNVPLLRNTEIVERPADQTTLTKRYTEEAVKFVKDNREEPFFLYLAHSMPHVPLFASEDFQGKSKRGLYGDVIEEIDYGVGEIVKTLKETGISENTLVVFTSDNGPWSGYNQHGGSSGTLQGGKFTTWEGGMRVPAVFWWPEKIKPAVVRDLGSTLDLFTTVSSLIGTDIPKDRKMDGVDLSPTLFDESKSSRDQMIYYRNTEIYAVRKGAYKLHYITRPANGKPELKITHEQPLLFDLNQDPEEKYNLAGKYPDVVEEINQLVKQHRSTIEPVKDQLADRIKMETEIKQ
ncbi:MAG: sulfatase [Bacteroidota bacterium]